MFYAVFVPPSYEPPGGEQRPSSNDLIFEDIKDANKALKRYKGARMKTFSNFKKAIEFLDDPDKDESFIETDVSQIDILESLEKLSLNSNSGQAKDKMDSKVDEKLYPSVEPKQLTLLKRTIEKGDHDEVESIIWSNPRHLIGVSDSAVNLMAGPRYNACHIAARANKPDIMALILDTVSNASFLKKLDPNEPDSIVQDRVNHLLDSYLNTPDPRQGNTPLHFACKLGHHRVVRVLLTFEGCDLNLKDSNGLTAEESICIQRDGGDSSIKQKIKDMFKSQLNLPLYRDQLKKRLLLERRRSKAGSDIDSDNSFSDDSFMFVRPNNKTT